MQRTKSLKVVDNLNHLPDDFHLKLTDLEIKLEKEILNHSQLRDLFELYTVNNIKLIL